MSIQDARIVLLEARMRDEMADLIRRNGGRNPVCVPAVREVTRDCGMEVAGFLERMVARAIHMLVFFTGVGVKTLCEEAEKLGRQEELLAALRNITIVCRGPKPSAVLRRYAIPFAASAREPYTTAELLEALAPFDVAGRVVGIVHYGEYNATIAHELRTRGADLDELLLYEWQLPEDTQELRELVGELLRGEVDAIVFTSQVQARHLFMIADKLQLAGRLSEALNSRTIVASIGPTCTGILRSYGVTPHVVPDHPKMGHLVKALTKYME